MASRVLLAAVVLTCCLVVGVFADSVDDNESSWTHAPHHAPSYSPAKAPPPFHHHKGRREHHKYAPSPAVHPPAKTPEHSPVHAPKHSPVKAPVHAPEHAPVHYPKPASPPTAHPPTVAPVHSPVRAPVHAPVKAPVHPPVHAPVHPPVHLPIPVRKLVAVQGVVYCKSCKYKGVDTLLGATPIEGVVVLLTCNNTKYPLKVKGTTDKNGYFFITPPKTVSTYGCHKCKVTLLSSPMVTCNQPTNLHDGIYGAKLPRRQKPRGMTHPLGYDVFTVGPFAFEPSPKTPCPKSVEE